MPNLLNIRACVIESTAATTCNGILPQHIFMSLPGVDGANSLRLSRCFDVRLGLRSRSGVCQASLKPFQLVLRCHGKSTQHSCSARKAACSLTRYSRKWWNRLDIAPKISRTDFARVTAWELNADGTMPSSAQAVVIYAFTINIIFDEALLGWKSGLVNLSKLSIVKVTPFTTIFEVHEFLDLQKWFEK